jgi:hypothetical protein
MPASGHAAPYVKLFTGHGMEVCNLLDGLIPRLLDRSPVP